MRIPFKDRYEIMGLEGISSKGFYRYSDQYAEVVYRQVTTMVDEGNNNHNTDDTILPIIAIFTKHPVDDEEYIYCGVLSELYQFMGYDVLNKKIRDSINEIGDANVIENPIIKYDKTFLRNEFIIQSSHQTISEVGDIFPVIITENSYNGSRAATLSFGLSTHSRSNSIVFKFDLGKIRQTHIVNSSSEMTSTVASYMNVFSDNIIEIVERSFEHKITEDQMFNMLDLVEKFGKNRRNEVSKLLTELNPTTTGEMPSAWQMFLAIVTYSSFEPNLNIKRLLENAAESVLVIPTRMYNVLEQLQKQPPTE